MPSKHSGSSHSSSSSSYSSSSRSSYSRPSSSRPSSHSSSSHSSYSSNRRSYNNRYYTTTPRARYNQPIGYYPRWSWLFMPSRRPRTYYCRNHTYVFYPQSWTDNSGRTYESGYYDENGKYYKEIALKNYDSLHEVMLKCDNCGYVINRNIDEDDITTCPNCGSEMNIVTNVDEFIAEDEAEKRRSFWKTLGTLLLGLGMPILLIGLLFTTLRARTHQNTNNTQIVQPAQTTKEKYLKKVDTNKYQLVSSQADKTIVYDANEDCYYDKETDMWLWYNTTVSPKVWQYWYEPISGDFGDYGWMEYDIYEKCWYVEADYNKWIKVPAAYDTSKLWYIND